MRCSIVLMISLLACSHPNYDSNVYRGQPDPRNKELVLGVGDVLEINVWDQKDLNTEATIRPDGTITMPLVGDLRAQGETPTAVREKIKASLAHYMKLPAGNEITVKVKSWNSYRFTINGEVQRPGVYTNPNWIQVADALALAGGPTRFADREAIILLRKNGQGKAQHIPLNFDLLASGKRPDMNIWVLPNDVIYVP